MLIGLQTFEELLRVCALRRLRLGAEVLGPTTSAVGRAVLRLATGALTIALLVAAVDPAQGPADQRRVDQDADRLDRQSRTSGVEDALRRAER